MRTYTREDLVVGKLLSMQADDLKNQRFVTGPSLAGEINLTFAELEEHANRVANGFAREGIQRGDHVAIMLPNCAEMLYTLFGLAKLGAISVPINVAYRGDIFEHQLKSSDSIMLVIDGQFVERIAFSEARLPKLKKVFVRTNAAKPTGLKSPAVAFRTLVDAPATVPDIAVLHSESLALMYTSGTTGPSKGVDCPHAHGPTSALGFIELMRLTDQDRLFCPMPLFHAVGFWQATMGALMVGGEMVLAERFSASQWWSNIRKYKATIGVGIHSIGSILLNAPPSPDDKNHTMRAFYVSPSALDKPMFDRFGARCMEIYGATEDGIVTMNEYGNERPGSCGRERSDYFELKIFDEFDRELPAGEQGEIVVRPRVPFSMFSGYYNFDAATVKAWRNLWFHSGDRGYFDKDGFFYFVDRIKDAVRRRGEMVSSYEVERVLNAHPAVLESALIPVPSELGEDELKACIVLRAGTHLEPEELLDFCQPRMAHFMVPRYIEFIKELPKTPTEKVEKYKLRAEGNKGITPHTWDREKVGYKVKR